MSSPEESRSASFSSSKGVKRKFQPFDFNSGKSKKAKQKESPAPVLEKNPETNNITNPASPKPQELKKLQKPRVVNFKHGQNTDGSTKHPKTVLGPQQSRQEILKQCRDLPIFSAKQKLLQKMSSLPSAILIGETGSGKTTQIPKYFYEAGVHRNHMIAITQPRRVAAITVAQRVAQEMNVDCGQLVGYQVRFDDCTSESTRLKYMTDGMLLREAILDPVLKRYSVIILDEAHERTIHTDVLFGVIKKAQKKRRKKKMLHLKILVMSATMDVDHFSQYFNNAPVLYVEGRQFPVQVMYCKDRQSDYLFASLVTVFQIHKETPPEEAVLVFLTGQEEIEATVRSIQDIAKELPSDSAPLVVYPLYSSLPPTQQLRVFQPAPKGHRKVIISTNIAETSVTIHGIKHVVDSGMVKLKSFQPSSGLEVLKVSATSKAQAWQRTGRAGREYPGTCYRLYTEDSFEGLTTNTVPEIQRCSLSSVALQLLALGIPDVFHFDFLDKPSPEALKSAFEHLLLLEAITKEGEDLYKLTDNGRKMAAFPLEPGLAKALLAAHQNSCLEEMLTVVAILSSDSVLYTPHSKREQANAVRRKFVSIDGDHMTMLNVYRSYKGVKGNKQWCYENFINQKNMKLSMEVRAQLKDICVTQKMDIKSCGRDTTAVRKSLVAGFFMNTAELQKEGHYATVSSRKNVVIHPSSALFMTKPSVVLYNELIETNKCYIRDVSVVDPEWLYEVAPAFFRRKLRCS